MLVTTGCNPQNAKITEGSYTTFLATGTSPTLRKRSMDVQEYGEGRWEDGSHWQIDCREGLESDDMLPDAIDICGDLEADHERWLVADGFEAVSAPLDPWRGEAVMTSEGDLQVTFHQRLPNGEDFRFAFVVDPDFQPSSCQLDENGESSAQPIDGDWVAEWTAEEAADAENPFNPDAAPSTFETLYYLNAGAYQFNPSNTEAQWYFPQQWLAGFAASKFADDSFAIRSVRYGLPSVYAAFEADGIAVERSDLFFEDDAEDFPDLVAEVEQIQVDTVVDLELAGVTTEPKVHTNQWREVDEVEAGVDGWVELNYNWVGFDQASEDLIIGNPASGAFNLVLDGTDSQSKVFVSGSFEIKKIKKDHWVVDDLETVKLEENGVTLCD